MRKSLILVGLLAMLCLAGVASATSCARDVDCTGGQYCEEIGMTGALATCANVSTTGCNGSDISCSTNADCVSKGKQVCSPLYGICMMSSSLGDVCQIDADCGSGNICRGDVCSSNIYKFACSSQVDCGATQSCFEGYCREKARLGAECASAQDCGIYLADGGYGITCDTTNRVCVQCNVASGFVGAGQNMPPNYFCNIAHYSTCSPSSMYSTYAATNSFPVPTVEPKKAEGDDCIDSACCLTNTCHEGRCVGAGDYPAGDDGNTTYSTEFCTNPDYGYSLSTHWFDNAIASTDFANATMFANFFNYSADSFFTINYAETNARSQPGFTRRAIVNGRYDMFAMFYSNSTGDVCYFRQIGTQIYWHCINGCLASGIATKKSGTGYITDSIYSAHLPNPTYLDLNCQDSTLGLSFKYESDSLSGLFGIAVVHGMDGNSIDGADVWFDGISGVSIYSHDGAITHSTATYVQSPYSRLNADWSWSMAWSNQYIYTSAGRYLHSGHLTPSISNGNYETDLSCCVTDSDCELTKGEGYKCNQISHSCYFSPTGAGELTFDISSSDSAWLTGAFCTNTTTSIRVGLLNGNDSTPVYPQGTITVTHSGNGTTYPESCNAYSTPCTFTITTQSTGGYDDLFIEYSGDTNYDPISIGVEMYITATCHYAYLKVYDQTVQQQTGAKKWLNNVKIVSSLGQTFYTVTDGHVIFTTLPASSINFTLSKDGYDTATFSFDSSDLDTITEIGLFQTGTSTTPTINYELTNSTPTNVSDTTRGFLEITQTFIGIPFTWIIMIITFLIGIGVVKYLFSSVM
jgi:hypothetical protein